MEITISNMLEISASIGPLVEKEMVTEEESMGRGEKSRGRIRGR